MTHSLKCKPQLKSENSVQTKCRKSVEALKTFRAKTFERLSKSTRRRIFFFSGKLNYTENLKIFSKATVFFARFSLYSIYKLRKQRNSNKLKFCFKVQSSSCRRRRLDANLTFVIALENWVLDLFIELTN